MTASKTWLIGLGVVMATAMVGCGNDNNPPAAAPAPTPTAAATEEAAPAAAPASGEATPAAPAVPPAPVPTSPPVPATTGPAAAGATTAPGMMATAETQAQELMQQAYQYIKDNKMDLAEKAVAKLQEMKGSLPAEYGPRIDQLKAALDAANVKNGKLPGGIKLPGQ